MQNDIVCHEIVRRPSYWSNIFSTQIFQELLIVVGQGGLFLLITLLLWQKLETLRLSHLRLRKQVEKVGVHL